MANNLNVSENTFGNNATLIQGVINATLNIGTLHSILTLMGTREMANLVLFTDSPGESSWPEKISQTNPTYNKKRILESKGPFLYESFQWILDHEDFNRWRNTEKAGVFWIKGAPGKGKTMLLGGLVDHLEKNPGNISLTYFFCQATDSRINTATAIIGGLIVSFIKQHQELHSYMYGKYKDDFDKLNGPDRWYILCDMFEKVTQHPALQYPVCVIDALDECEQEDGCKQLLKLIIKTSCRVKWLISSRNITEIERQLQAIDSSRRLSLELKENAKFVTNSVDLYIDDSIQNIMALQGDKELQTTATNTLKSKANGTFLWVALVVEQLRETKHRNVKKVLEEMPEGLENLYSLILQRLFKQEEKDAYQILLSIITAAERPLHLEELQIFMSSQWKSDEIIDDLRDIREIVEDCRSFLSIQNNIVYFIHQSVKDYMMGAASKIILPSGIEYQHYIMFKTSLSAMSRILKHNIYNLKDPGSEIFEITPPDPNPLAPIAYCCIFWVEHLFRSCESGASRNKRFLKDGGTLHSFLRAKYLCWLESLALLNSLIPQGVNAIQKLKSLLSGYYKRKPDERHVGEMASLRGERKANHLGLFIHSACHFIHRFRDLYLGMCIKYAYTIFHSSDDSQLRAFINDAYQFFHYCKGCVRKYPLQLYYSAFTFEDTHSAVYTTFQQIIRAEFKNIPTLMKMPQKQFSLVQNIELKCHGPIIVLLYSPDSSFLCSLSHGGTISLCRTDTCTLECVIELGIDENHKYIFLLDRQYHLIAFSSTSKYLVSISRSGVVQVWAVGSGTQVRKLSLNLNTSLVLRPKRSQEEDASQERGKTLQEEVIALSYYGDLAASTCRALSGIVSSVKVWTIEAGECMCVISQSHMPDILHAAFSPNSAMIVLVSKTEARVYSIQTSQEIKRISQPVNSPGLLGEHMIHSRFSLDSKLLALKYTNRNICLWCTETWTMVRHIRSKLSTTHFDLSPDAAMSVISYKDALFIENMNTGETLITINPHIWVNSPIFSPDWKESSLLASFSNHGVQIWRAYINTGAKSSKINNTISHVTISPKSKFVAARHGRDNVEVWRGASGDCIQVLKAITWPFLVFSPNLELVASTRVECDVQIWHVETGKLLHLFKGPGDGQYNVPAAFSDDSAYIAAGYRTGQVKVWCVKFGKCLWETNGHDDGRGILGVAFSPGSKYIASISSGSPMTVCTWDWRTGHCISRTELEFWQPMSLTFSSDATVLVIITELSFDSYQADFYDITSDACVGLVNIGKSNSLPVFDSAKDHIVSDRFRFCKTSSWMHWDTISEPRYSYFESSGEIWICFGEHKVFHIPDYMFYFHLSISDSLLALVNTAGQLITIKLPSEYIIEQ